MSELSEVMSEKLSLVRMISSRPSSYVNACAGVGVGEGPGEGDGSQSGLLKGFP